MNGMLTIFTPAYNRAYTLNHLYESLCQQSSKDFEWIIVDDGSTDNTKELITLFINEHRINIRYFYQKNGGKHRAINYGTQVANGELFFIVDSDDFLTLDAIEQIESKWNSIDDKTSYAGLCFRKMHINTDEFIGNEFPFQEFDSNSLDLAFRWGIREDKAEIFQTQILRQFPFPEVNGENFVPEALIWYKIAYSGLFLRCINTGIYRCEYLPDGLSKNFASNLRKNPKGFFLYYQSILSYKKIPIFPEKVKAFVRIVQCYFYKVVKYNLHIGYVCNGKFSK